MRPALAVHVDPDTRRRWDHQGLAWRVLYGHWREDLRQRIRDEVGSARGAAWGEPDLGASLLTAAASSVATLYDRGLRVHHDSMTLAERMTRILRDSRWPVLARRNQRDTIALREMCVYAEQRPGGGVTMWSVAPHEVEAEPDPMDPSQPIAVRWWRLRRSHGGGELWTVDVFDARPGRECYRIEDDRGRDVSPEYMTTPDGFAAPEGGYRGAAYPFRRADGTAYVPWVWYHAEDTGRLWDYAANVTLLDSTMTVGVLWTYWRHVVQTASWPQRYLIGGEIMGQDTIGEGSEARRVVVADPAVLLRVSRDGEHDGMPSIHQDGSNADPMSLGQAIAAYERRAVASAGLNPADVSRIDGDPRSGYAMAITRDGQREAQRRYEPSFRASDERLCSVIALLSGLPADGWRIEYGAVPPTTAELLDAQRYVDGEISSGRMSALQAYLYLHPEVSVEDGQIALDAIASLRAPEERGGLLIGQMDAVLNVVSQVSAGVIPRDTGIALVRTFLAVDSATAETLMGSAGEVSNVRPEPDDEPDPDDSESAGDDPDA